MENINKLNKIIFRKKKYWHLQSWLTPFVKTGFQNDTLSQVLGSVWNCSTHLFMVVSLILWLIPNIWRIFGLIFTPLFLIFFNTFWFFFYLNQKKNFDLNLKPGCSDCYDPSSSATCARSRSRLSWWSTTTYCWLCNTESDRTAEYC